MFTKWIEIEPIAKITLEAAKRFVLKSVMTKFIIPSKIITDNDTQFSSVAFIKYCEELGTKICFASVAHRSAAEQRATQAYQQPHAIRDGEAHL